MAKPDPCSKCNFRHPSNVECQIVAGETGRDPRMLPDESDETHYCTRCGIEHLGKSLWQCIACGAILCAAQVQWREEQVREVDNRKWYHETWVFGKKEKILTIWCGPCRLIVDRTPQVDVVLTKAPVSKNPRKLKGTWKVEPAEQLEEAHGIDSVEEAARLIRGGSVIEVDEDTEPLLEHE